MRSCVQLIPLALSAHPLYPKDSPLFSGNKPVFGWCGFFSPPAIISACWGCRCYLHLRSLLLLNAHCSGTSSWGDLYDTKKIKQNGRDLASPKLWACNSSAAIRCLQNVAETLQEKKKKKINKQPQSNVSFLGEGSGGLFTTSSP